MEENDGVVGLVERNEDVYFMEAMSCSLNVSYVGGGASSACC